MQETTKLVCNLQCCIYHHSKSGFIIGYLSVSGKIAKESDLLKIWDNDLLITWHIISVFY